MSSGSWAFAVWNRAEALAALAVGQDRLHQVRGFDAECDAQGLTEDAKQAAYECLSLRTLIEAGNGGAVLDAIGHCADIFVGACATAAGCRDVLQSSEDRQF